MATRMLSPRGGVSFRDEDLKGQRFGMDKGRMSTQGSEDDLSPRNSKISDRNQGEFSGMYDKKGHHLKSDGTPDMRFKENREEFEGEGFEYTSQGRTSGQSQTREKSQGRMSQRSSLRSKSRGKSSQRNRSSEKSRESSEHTKGDGTPDMRFKENRDEFSGEGYENTTSRSSRLSKANMGLYEGNVPGEHSGKFDEGGHHLKNDGTPDMRFKENREEYSGQGFETTSIDGSSRKTPRYLKEEDSFEGHTIYYRRRRPPTPYALYIRERAPEMKRENEDMDMNEVFRQLGDEWRNSSDKYKQKFYDMYEDEIKRWEEVNQMPHRGNLSMRKSMEKRGLPSRDFSFSKRGKYSSGRRMRNMENQETLDDENDDYEEDEDYTPGEDEENINPNEGITA